MPRSIQTRPSREAAPLLATGLTLMYGVVGCSFVVAFYSETPLLHLGIVFGVAVVSALLLWVMRRVAPSAGGDLQAWAFGRRQEDPLAGYSAAPKRKRASRFGDRKPATLDEVRELNERTNANVWVPSGGRDS